MAVVFLVGLAWVLNDIRLEVRRTTGSSQIETADGKVRTGMLVRTVLDEYTYLDEKGGLFKLNTRKIVDSRSVPISIMPDGLADLLTDQELRDLFAYLGSRR